DEYEENKEKKNQKDRILGPKDSSEDDKFPFENIEKHVRATVYLDKWPCKKQCKKDPRKVGSVAVEKAFYLLGIYPVSLPILTHCGQCIAEGIRIEMGVLTFL